VESYVLTEETNLLILSPGQRGFVFNGYQEEKVKRRDFMKTVLIGSGMVLLASKAYPLKFYPNVGPGKWAVLFGSRYGSTRDAAVWISEGMWGIAEVFDARENPDLSAFDNLIVGSGIYDGKVAPPLETFLTQNAAKISAKVRAVFVVCGAGGTESANRYLDMIAKLCGNNSVVKKSFPGRMTKRLFDAEVLKYMEEYYKKINRPFEDYDRLQRKDCLQFGEEILKKFSK
jgi:menaquinone-dependent protoporphyrinogen oxidase